MPPDASSRTSTYLPKICGNIGRAYASAVGVASLLSACGNEPAEARVVPIHATLVDGCGAARPELYQLEALGDFDASPLTSETITLPSASGTPLHFPRDTRAVEIRGEGSATNFWGLGELTAERRIDVLLLPDDQACDLFRPDASRPYPLASGGQAIGFSRRHRVLLVAGGLEPSGDSARALALRIDTSQAEEVPSGMIPGRAFATATELGPDALLVAGGIDPIEPSASEIASAITYDVRENRFDRSSLVALSKPRARHGAMVLENGETLLVGGSVDGAASPSLELVSPLDRAARVPPPSLERARIAPSVLRLDDGRIFIAGGHDAEGQPVAGLEWLSADASEHLAPPAGTLDDVIVVSGAAFVAMPGGSVLAVGVCSAADCTLGASLGRVGWIRGDYVLEQLPPLPFEPSAVALVAASDAAPFLIATTESGARVVLRFDPWSNSFEPPPHAPEPPAAGVAPPIAVDPGMFVWLEPFGAALGVRAFRHDTRSTYARDVAPLLLADARHLGPDRAPSVLLAYGAGGLRLEASAQQAAPRVIVTDTSYAELGLEIELGDGPPARIALGDALLGDADCTWPEGEGPLVIRRIGTSVTLERNGNRRTCPIGSERVEVGLVAPASGASLVRRVSVRRSTE